MVIKTFLFWVAVAVAVLLYWALENEVQRCDQLSESPDRESRFEETIQSKLKENINECKRQMGTEKKLRLLRYTLS